VKTWMNGGIVGLAIVATAFGVMRAQPGPQSQRFPQFENDDVKVWRSLVVPNSPLTLHRHDHPRVIIALHGGTMKIEEQNGPTETHVWETSKAYWLPANPPNTLHVDVNAGDKPIEVIVVELKHEKD
jgi:beta-alanine degradation protein BauB